MPKRILKIIGFFAVGMAGGIFAEQFFWPFFIGKPIFDKYGVEQPVYVTERKEITIRENTALENAIGKVGKTVVGIKTETSDGKIIEGSGLVITSDGVVVTLAELVPQGSVFSFFVGGRAVSFQILKRDLKNNLALIKVKENNLSTVSFSNFDKIKLGQRVFLAGVIFDKDMPKDVVNEGIVKRLDGEMIDTNISDGNDLRGSPLFDIEGNVMGLNTQNISGDISAIPAPRIKEFAGF